MPGHPGHLEREETHPMPRLHVRDYLDYFDPVAEWIEAMDDDS